MKFIYSHGGYAREMHQCVLAQYPNEQVAFVDDNPSKTAISYDESKNIGANVASSFVISFADPALRLRKTEQVLSDGFSLFSVQAATAIIGENVVLGEGSVMSDFALITSDARIGVGFQCNIYSFIAHDCVVGDFVTLAPRVSVNGRVEIGDGVYIGTGATILPGEDGNPVRIGSGAVVGAHALVTRDVPEGVTVVGIPAKQLKKAP
jgi:sugar O-acyltransferase (sialic acid O-acetyltransferase NeuD family)